MPIDSRIPLSVQPFQAPDPLKSYSNALTIKNQQDQQRLHEQQMQENQLKLDQVKQDRADDQTLRDSMLRHQGDLDKVLPDVAGTISQTRYQNLQKSILEEKTKRAALSKDESDRLLKLGEHAAGAIDGILRAPKEQWQTLWTNAKQNGVAQGILTPEMVKALPDEVPDEANLRMLHAQMLGGKLMQERVLQEQSQAPDILRKNLENAARTVPDDPEQYAQWRASLPKEIQSRIPEEYSPEAVDQIRTSGLTPEQQLKAPGEKLDVEQKRLQSKATFLSGSKTVGDYMKRRGGMTFEEGSKFPDLSGRDPKSPLTDEDRKAILQPGLNPQQQMQAMEQAADNKRLSDHNKAMEEFERQRIAIQKQLLSLRRQGVNRQNRRDAIEAEHDFDKAAEKEGNLHQQRKQLGEAIARAKWAAEHGGYTKNTVPFLTFIDKSGRVTTMDKITGEAPKSVEGMVQDMQSRYESITSELERVMADKYKAMDRLGATPDVTLQESLAAIKAGTESLLGPKKEKGGEEPKQTPSAPKPQAQAPKQQAKPQQTFTEADLRARSKARGMTPEQIEQAVRAAKERGLIR